MGTEYKIKVIRKCDGKKLGEFFANELKCIMESQHASKLGIEQYSGCDKIKFDGKQLSSAVAAFSDECKSAANKILEKKLSVLLAKNIDVKHELDEDLIYAVEDLDNVVSQYGMLKQLYGKISYVIEDGFVKNKPAYERNCADLEKTDGKDKSMWMFTDDWECEITALY